MTSRKRRIALEKENTQYFAYCEDLSGVYGLGSSIAEAKSSLVKAIRLRALQIKKTQRSPKNS